MKTRDQYNIHFSIDMDIYYIVNILSFLAEYSLFPIPELPANT